VSTQPSQPGSTPAGTTAPDLNAIGAALSGVRSRLDDFIVGQDPVKEAMVLALIAHEHIYLMGEPGSAKTLLAEVAGGAANLRFQFNQMHRDTRLAELIGDVQIARKPLEDGTGEIIQQVLRPGGILTADVALLDDISRAPGEALNVLLRILNERKYQTMRIPLMTAIGTSNPTTDEYYNEPLDPANLDRFTLQLKTKGTVGTQQWSEARRIMDRYDGFQADLQPGSGAVPANVLRSAREALRTVRIPPRVLEAYQKFLDNLINKYGCTPENSLLSDRTMLIKVPRMIKALALLEGRDEANVGDLRVLKHILTFRIPENLYENLENLLNEVVQELEQQEEMMSEESEEQQQGAQGQEESSESGDEAQDQDSGGDKDLVDQLMEAMQAQGEESEKRKSMQQQSASPEDGSPQFQRNQAQHVENLDVLLDKIRGRLERNQADAEIHPGGSPRTYRRMKSFEEFMDTDPGDTAIWMNRVHPTLPRAFHRKKKNVGGKVVIIRDVSQSMEGRYARWTSSVVTRMVDMVRKKRMRIGYIEFNHVSRKYQHDGRFFTRDYDKLIDKAANVSCSGVTNYQYPLRDALVELKKGRGSNRHILFLTDGEPTQGDWLVREERKQAKQMGVSIHTLFIGTTECPEILDILSEETDGSQFLATPDDRGGLNIAERFSRATQAAQNRPPFPDGPPGAAPAPGLPRRANLWKG
jgi:MoxR-like ATPase